MSSKEVGTQLIKRKKKSNVINQEGILVELITQEMQTCSDKC